MNLVLGDAVTWVPESGIWAVDEDLARLSRFGRVLVGIVERLGDEDVPLVIATATGDAERSPAQLHASLQERWPGRAIRWVCAKDETVPMSLFEVGLQPERTIWVVVELTPGAELAVAAFVSRREGIAQLAVRPGLGRHVSIVRGEEGKERAETGNPCVTALNLCSIDPLTKSTLSVGRWQLVLSSARD